MVEKLRIPEDVAWTTTEQLFALIKQVHGDLETVIDKLSGPGGGGGSNVPPQELETVLASKYTGNLAGVISVPVSILARLMSNYEDYGIVSKLGTANQLTDTNKLWQPHIFQNHTVYMLIGTFLYNVLITDNDNQNLFFNTLANSAQPAAGTIYWIKPSLNSTKWGIPGAPTWNYNVAITAPGAGAVLATHTVAAGVKGYIFGISISVGEANVFLLNWISGGTARSKRIVFGSQGSIVDVEEVAMNAGLLADTGTAITITNINAGGAGVVYQADVLVGES